MYRYTHIYSECVHTNICITHVYARTCINTLACKLRHAAFSEMHMGTHTYVLTWIRAHTHDLLKAAPSAYGRAKKKKRLQDPELSLQLLWQGLSCGPSLQRGWISVCRQSHSVRHIHEHRLEPRQTHSLTYPIMHFSVVTCIRPAATPPFS